MAKFQQRHYEAVADLFWIRRQELDSMSPPSIYQGAHWNEWALLQERFKGLFLQDNPRFRSSLFDKACGVKA